MAGTKFGSRKLMLILAFLLINSYSISYFKLSTASDDISSSAAHDTDTSRTKDVVWLVDATNGQCLGAHGDFSECGELTLWIWNRLKRGISLQSVSTVEEESHSVHSIASECLGRRRSLVKSGELAMRRCSEDPFTSTLWNFDESTGMMSDRSMLSKVAGSVCISNSESILQSCKEGFTALKRVVFHNSASVLKTLPDPVQEPLLAPPTSESLDFSDVGIWKCPVTGQVFPRNLDRTLSAPVAVPLTSYPGPAGAIATTRGGSAASGSVSQGRQVFMGSGVFSKNFMGMNFNVYSMAWYVEADAARADPSLLAFKDRSLSELQSTEAFFQALSSSGRGFDRTLMVKLAMTLKTKMLLEGFLSEIVLQPQNKEAVRRASAAYTPLVCPEGLEIIFTWRVPHKAASTKHSGAKGSGMDHEYLEVRIGDMYFELHEAGLAEDFMRQFFAPENPVSPSAKKAFVTYFPALLRGGARSTLGVSASAGAGAGVVDVSTPAPVTRSKSKYAGFFGLRVSTNRTNERSESEF